jgi:hypothetical protein
MALQFKPKSENVTSSTGGSGRDRFNQRVAEVGTPIDDDVPF